MLFNGKRILVITSIYPGELTPNGYTPVVHYFVKEWVALGYEVRVIYIATYFPSCYYRAPKWLRKSIQNKWGIALPDVQHKDDIQYRYEQVIVRRIPVKKIMPMSGFSEKELAKACEKSDIFIQTQNFKPDVIISHWVNPQLAIMSFLKERTGATTVMVLHDSGIGMKKVFKNWHRLFDDVDIWGYRSNSIKVNFEKAFGIPKYSFRCFSGIPSSYCTNVPNRNGEFHNHYIQVGLLIDRKYPHKTIEGVSMACKDVDFTLDIIGDGGLFVKLQELIVDWNLQSNVNLLGRLPREEVIGKLDKADVFILISRNEVFGLVYIEAMARGCIVIASRGEGMEGILVDGVNGFFCEAGNSDELVSIIQKIQHMTKEQRLEISHNAQKTAARLTDQKVAKDYIEKVMEFKEHIMK